MQIMYVEDETHNRDMLTQTIRGANHRVEVFTNSLDAMNYLNKHEPDVVLTDYKLGDSPDGLMLAENVRQRYLNCVVIIISQYADFDKAVRAMHLNVDDFIKKPIAGHELLERIYQAVARRRAWLSVEDEQTEVEEIPNLTIDRNNKTKRTVKWHGKTIKLTPTEFKILSILTSKPGKPFSFGSLAAAISQKPVSSSDAARAVLKTQVRNLRLKLAAGNPVNCIHAVRGKGYRWRVDDSSPAE
jgi:DNA-binding response OmpR family regulator